MLGHFRKGGEHEQPQEAAVLGEEGRRQHQEHRGAGGFQRREREGRGAQGAGHGRAVEPIGVALGTGDEFGRGARVVEPHRRGGAGEAAKSVAGLGHLGKGLRQPGRRQPQQAAHVQQARRGFCRRGLDGVGNHPGDHRHRAVVPHRVLVVEAHHQPIGDKADMLSRGEAVRRDAIQRIATGAQAVRYVGGAERVKHVHQTKTLARRKRCFPPTFHFRSGMLRVGRVGRSRIENAAIVELIRVGNNLNQMARATNSGHPPASAELRAALGVLRGVLERLHQSDCGGEPQAQPIDASRNAGDPAGERDGGAGGSADGP